MDLRVFRHRGFTVSVVTISLTFAAYFAASVLTPLWLQSFMGYKATNAGMTTAWTGVSACWSRRRSRAAGAIRARSSSWAWSGWG